MTQQASTNHYTFLLLSLVMFPIVGACADAQGRVSVAADTRSRSVIGSSTVYIENRGARSFKAPTALSTSDADFSSPAIEDHTIEVAIELEPTDALQAQSFETPCTRCSPDTPDQTHAQAHAQTHTRHFAEDAPDNHVERFGHVSEMTVSLMATRQRQGATNVGTSSRISMLADELETLPGRGEAFSVTVEPHHVNWNLQPPRIPQILQGGQGKSLPRIGLTPAVSKP